MSDVINGSVELQSGSQGCNGHPQCGIVSARENVRLKEEVCSVSQLKV